MGKAQRNPSNRPLLDKQTQKELDRETPKEIAGYTTAQGSTLSFEELAIVSLLRLREGEGGKLSWCFQFVFPAQVAYDCV